MQFKNQWFGEALAIPAYPLDSRGETIFEGPGGPRSWIEGSSFGADADTASADLVGSPHEGATRESTIVAAKAAVRAASGQTPGTAKAPHFAALSVAKLSRVAATIPRPRSSPPMITVSMTGTTIAASTKTDPSSFLMQSPRREGSCGR